MNAIIQSNAEPIKIQRDIFPAMYATIAYENHAVNVATVHYRGQESATSPGGVLPSLYGRFLHREAKIPWRDREG